jgi:hypothetical protein
MGVWSTIRQFWGWLGYKRIGAGLLITGAPTQYGWLRGWLAEKCAVSLPDWPSWALTLIFGIGVLSWFLLRRLQELESAFVVNLELSDPVQTMKPGDQGQQIRRFSVEVRNKSAKEIKNVQLKMTRFVNRTGKESNHTGARFAWAVDRSPISPEFRYQQSVDIAACDCEVFDIAQFNESQSRDARVSMIYASPQGAAYGRNILVSAFPHDLTVRLTADGLTKPIDRSFILFVDESGVFRMQRS